MLLQSDILNYSSREATPPNQYRPKSGRAIQRPERDTGRRIEMKTYPHKSIIEVAQSRGSASKTKSGAWKYLRAHMPAPIQGRKTSDYYNGPDAAARYRAAKQDHTADGRARVLGYDLNDPNTPGRIQDRAWEYNRQWETDGRLSIGRDRYGAIYALPYHTPSPRATITGYRIATALISEAAKTGAIPASYDSIDFDRNGRADGTALHHELYDFATDAAIICIRRTEGTRYGVKTLSKSYTLIERIEGEIAATEVSIPVAKFAKLHDIEFGQIIARARGEEGARKLPVALSTWDEAYKALALDGDTLRSIFSGEEYTLTGLKRERAEDDHNGGYYCYPTIEQALQADVPETSKCLNLPRVIARCEVSGRAVTYGNGKIARTYLRPIEIVAAVL